MVSAVQWQGENTPSVGQILIKPTKEGQDSEHVTQAQETSRT